jgi:hypothetical protein
MVSFFIDMHAGLVLSVSKVSEEVPARREN